MDAIFVGQVGIGLFFGILFGQSGLDKVMDWKGNLGWLTGHFAATPFKNVVPLLLLVITLVEIAAGVTSLIGAGMIVFGQGSAVLLVGLSLSALALLMLFAGQRIAKDYPGAASLATYFGVLMLGLMVLR